MKKKKLSLEVFKVKSFVTSLESKTSLTLKGGATFELPLCDPNETNGGYECEEEVSATQTGVCTGSCQTGLRGCTKEGQRGQPISASGKGADTKVCL